MRRATRWTFAAALGLALPAALLVTPAGPAGAATTPSQVRYAGVDRYATAARISRGQFPSGAPTVFLARGSEFADALAAGPAAAFAGGPVLLVQRSAVPAVVATELARLAPKHVVLVGGTAAISSLVSQRVRSLLPTASLERVAGADRYDTAAQLAGRFGGTGRTVLVATGRTWPDAASGAAAGASLSAPLLLVDRGRIPATTQQRLTALAPSRIVVLGGTSVVPSYVVTALGRFAPSVERVAGRNRYDTSAQVADRLFGAGPRPVWLATGLDFPDAVAAGSPAGLEGAPVLLVPASCLLPPTSTSVDRLQPPRVVAVGGRIALSDAVPALEPCPMLSTLRLRATLAFRASSPIALLARPGTGDLYVVERAGRIRKVVGSSVAATPYLDISGSVSTQGEGGLLNAVFSADGRHLFTYSTLARSDGGMTLHVDEWAAGAASATGRRPLLAIAHPYRTNHLGGGLALRTDGTLLVGTGDSGGSYDPDNMAQRLTDLRGKILRIDPRPSPGHAYTVPADNPFAGGSGVTRLIWAYGLRNPFRIAVDPASGDLWIGDVGQDTVEEVDLLLGGAPGGQNYGWDYVEGNHRVRAGGPANLAAPVFTYRHSAAAPAPSGCAVIGGVVHRGPVSAMRGAYLFSDLCSGKVWALQQRAGRVVASRFTGVTVTQPDGFGTDGLGRSYVLTTGGGVYRLDAA